MKAIFLSLVLGAMGMLLQVNDAASQVFEPERGTALRKELLETVRPFAYHDFGAPIEFVVLDLLVDHDRAFARLHAQRPGGGLIKMAETPMVSRGRSANSIDAAEHDVGHIVAFLHRQAEIWYVVEFYSNSTDLWWIGYDYQNYRRIHAKLYEEAMDVICQ